MQEAASYPLVNLGRSRCSTALTTRLTSENGVRDRVARRYQRAAALAQLVTWNDHYGRGDHTLRTKRVTIGDLTRRGQIQAMRRAARVVRRTPLLDVGYVG